MSDSPRTFYSLPMFPYPSGTAMHVGHVSNFMVNEIVARYHRMLGDKVLFPIGYDSFGLPTENYAIKNNKSAQQATKENIEYYNQQLVAIDFSFDMDRVFNTSDPEYYRWTQWIFTKLYQHNLVYCKDGLVNWCNGCQTVLANDQVVDGTCERCDTVVIQKKHQQRYIKITDYADQLLDYTGCDRPTETKVHQTNWIGKSQGCEAKFEVKIPEDGGGRFEKIGQDAYYDKLSYEIIGASYDVHKALGSGLTEKSYHKAMIVALQKRGLYTESEKTINLQFEGEKVGVCRVDILVEGKIAVELKSRKIITGDYYKQLRTYMSQGGFDAGLIINFYNKSVEVKRLNKNEESYEKNLQISTTNLQISTTNLQISTNITVFTTRIDTIYGVTAIVLAPENSIIDQYLTDEKKSELATYRTVTAAKTAIERQHTEKEKTGFDSGVEVIHPLTGELVPVWYADYVLPDYATGAVMFVPAHDERDWEFAHKYNIFTKHVIAKHYVSGNPPVEGKTLTKRNNVLALLYDEDMKHILCLDRKKMDWKSFIMGGVKEGEDWVEAGIREIIEESGFIDIEYLETIPGEIHAEYFAAHKDVNRYSFEQCLVYRLKSDSNNGIIEDEENHSLHRIPVNQAEEYLSQTPGDSNSNLIFLQRHLSQNKAYTGQGKLINSSQFSGFDNLTAKTEIAQHLESIGKGKITTTYRLRDWSVSRQRYRGSPIPVYYTFEDNDKVPYFERNKKEGANYATRKSARAIIKHPTQDLYCFIKNNDGIVCIGGGLETDESYIDAASREIIEETGYDDFILKSLDTEYHYIYYKSSQDINYYYVSQLFYCELKSLFQREHEAHEGSIEWLTIDQIQQQNDVALNFYMDVILGLTPKSSITIDRYNAYNPHPDKSKWIPHLIPESDLPVVLPLDLPNYKPAGKSPLEDHPTFKYYKPKKPIPIYFEGKNNHVVAILKKNDGNFIFQKRDLQAPSLAGKISSFGGRVEQGETIMQGLIREIKEELNINIFEEDIFYCGYNRVKINDKVIFDHIFEVSGFDDQELILNEGECIIDESIDVILNHIDLSESAKSNIEFYLNVTKSPHHNIYLRECDTLDTFMCSSFYFLRFCDPHNDEELISDEAARQWMPVDLYVGGKEHTVGHLLYSRFIYKFLRQEGYIACESPEPFTKLVHQGMVHASDGRKMSKRRGNVIDPMEIVREYGSDTLRVYTMFMGPVEASKNRNPDAVAGVHRFLKRVEKLVEKVVEVESSSGGGTTKESLIMDSSLHSEGHKGVDSTQNPQASNPTTPLSSDLISLLHQTIQGVTEDIEALKFNTVVSKLMIMTNAFAEATTINQSDYLIFLKLLAPFATKVTQQVRADLGQEGSIHDSLRPEYDPKLIVASTIDLPIQINGKLRGTVTIDSGASQDSVMELAQSHENISKRLEGQIIKIIYIQDKICNIIIK